LVTVLVLAWVATAWACVPVRSLVSVTPQSSGPSGTQVTVSGVGFGSGDVEIRWNRPDGPQLAKTSGPEFSVPVTIPDAADGLYTLVAMTRAKDGGVDNAGVAPFLVTTAGATAGGPRPNAAPLPASSAGKSSKGGVGQLAWTLVLVPLAAIVGLVVARRRRTRT